MGSRSRTRPYRKLSMRARSELGEEGRLIIRPSGTEPVIRVMAQGDDQDLVDTIVGDIVEAVRRLLRVA